MNQLAFDPEDAKFETPTTQSREEIRSDRVLWTGARFYNDHGHPEFSTPECATLDEVVSHDMHGVEVMRSACHAYTQATGRAARAFKNNTDYHGASYGTHESYLVKRSLGVDRLFAAIMPLLVVRPLLVGAGKVGSESGGPCDYQISQRADFLVEPMNVETLYRRPLFNTRDEPHGDSNGWIRLHVISGDANMMPSCTRRKFAMVRLVLRLLEIGELPSWAVSDPVAAAKEVSRNPFDNPKIGLEGRSWTNARAILESYALAAKAHLTDKESLATADEILRLLDQRESDWDAFRKEVDWAAKHWIIDQYRDAEGWKWSDPRLASLCLQYHDIDPEEGLYYALVDAGEVSTPPALPTEIQAPKDTRANARGMAVEKFGKNLICAGWRRLVMQIDGKTHEIELDPNRSYFDALQGVESVEEFISAITAP